MVCPNCAATLDTHCGRQNRLVASRAIVLSCGNDFTPARWAPALLLIDVADARHGLGRPMPERRECPTPSSQPPPARGTAPWVIWPLAAATASLTMRSANGCGNMSASTRRRRPRAVGPRSRDAASGERPRVRRRRRRRTGATHRDYSLPSDRPHRPDPRRRPGHAHALARAQGAARPVRAADAAVADRRRARGRGGRIVVVGGPDRALEPYLPDGVELAVQDEARGTGDAVLAAADHIDPTATSSSCPATCPLITAEMIAALIAAQRSNGRGGHAGHDGAGRPERLRPRRARRRTARSSGSSRPRRRATRPTPSWRSTRSTPASTPSPGARCCDALRELRPDNAQGEYYLPDVAAGPARAGGPGRRPGRRLTRSC